ncbi:MAG: hypothetical protein IJB55_02135 [Firmicutes bacterium]|nr:hypothetical protein [Bacillota bacterium]
MSWNSNFGGWGCNSCNNNWGWNNGGCGNNIGNNIGNSAFCFIGEWVNIVVTLTILQSILGLVCNWNCGCNNCNNC